MTNYSPFINDILKFSKTNTFNYLLDETFYKKTAFLINKNFDTYLNTPHLFVGTNEISDKTEDAAMNVIIRSKEDEARLHLQEMSPVYRDFDWSTNEFETHKKEIYKVIKIRVKEDLSFKFDKMVDWDHIGHINIIRNKMMLKRYDNLTKTNEYNNQPINLVLPIYYYRKNLSGKNLAWFEEFLEIAGVFKNVRAKSIATSFGEITGLVKKYRSSMFGDDWSDLCDLGTLFGYNMKTNILDLGDEIALWTSEKDDIKPKDCDYYKEFEKVLSEIYVGKNIENDITLIDYINNAHLWVVAGSANGIKDELYDSKAGENVKSSSKKMAIFTTMSADSIFSDVTGDVQQPPMIPNVKIELGFKDRLIIASGNWEYIRMSYISHHLDPILKGSGISPFYEPIKFKFDNYEDDYHRLAQGEVGMPLDSKKFDYYIKKKEIEIMHKVFESCIKSNLKIRKTKARLDLLRVMGLIIRSYSVHGWTYVFNGKTYKWVDGMPSGIRWTALGDTLINYARGKVISEYIKKKWRMNVLEKIVAAGDDDDFIVSSWFSGFLIFKTYGMFGIPVSPAKNFLANDVTEFLKTLVTKNGILKGYKARKVASLFFISPEKKAKPEGTYDEINYAVWEACVRRGLKITNELSQDTNFITLGHAPRCIGGLGMWINMTTKYNKKLIRHIIVGGRYRLVKVRKGTGVSNNILRTIDLLKQQGIDFDNKRFVNQIKINIGGALVPLGRNDIMSIEDKELPKIGVFEIDETYVINELLIGMRIKHLKKFRLNQEYSWLDFRTVLTCIEGEGFLQFINLVIHQECITTLNLILDSTSNQTEKLHKLRRWLDPVVEYKVPYTKRYSVEYLSAYLGPILDRLTLRSLIQYNTMNNDDQNKVMMNKIIQFETSLQALLDMPFTEKGYTASSIGKMFLNTLNVA